MSAMLRRNSLVLILLRLRALWHQRAAVRRRPRASAGYLLRGRELSNFTYDLANLDELTTCVAEAFGVKRDLVARYVDELYDDDELREALAAGLRTHPNRPDSPRYTKRPAYYAIVRLIRPTTVVETGTHDGLGAAVVARALQRNAAAGAAPGKLLTFDLNPDAGWVVPPSLQPLVKRIAGPTSRTLEPALDGEQVDFFIHDSLRTPENERFEFETIIRYAAGPRLVLATDHAPDTFVLRDICAERGGFYTTFREQPDDHFFAGVELGLGVLEIGDQ